jgi:hypothetical protein
VALTLAYSIGQYAWHHKNDGLQQNVATWGRNHHLGKLVDKMEVWLHGTPPSKTAAGSLALNSGVTADSTPKLSDDTVAPGSTTTSTTIPGQPDNIPAVVSPALDGEGAWKPIATAHKIHYVWATSIRPLTDYPSVVATAAIYNPTTVHTAMYNGTEVPGKGPWTNYKKVQDAALPSLIAAFNGGFRFEHNPGGYMAEGVPVRRMKDGYATFGIRADGTSTIGVWGDTMKDDGAWTSLRQNLPPLVEGGKVVYQNYPSVNWGENYGNKVYSLRSAVCLRFDGNMMFAAVGDVNIDLLARSLANMGCDTAMELDINGTWPQFATYTGFGTSSRWGRVIDKRMGNPNRFIQGYTKDFFALFDPLTLPANVVK